MSSTVKLTAKQFVELLDQMPEFKIAGNSYWVDGTGKLCAGINNKLLPADAYQLGQWLMEVYKDYAPEVKVEPKSDKIELKSERPLMELIKKGSIVKCIDADVAGSGLEFNKNYVVKEVMVGSVNSVKVEPIGIFYSSHRFELVQE
jgi:hypothetical protein